jgi:glycosyltransferase involved in cell wall biosynthesis
MRLLWMSNAPWVGTGYGMQTKHMLPILRDQGHDAACFAYWGLEGSPIDWEGFRIYPPLFDKWGNDAVREHMRDWQADALLTLFDPFVIDPFYVSAVGWRWFPWVPIDSDGLPRGFEVLEHARFIIAMSEHGRRQLLEAGHPEEKVFNIPHGVDCRIHRNRSEEERRDLRTQLGLDPEAFIVGMVQANKGSRKALDVQIKAFAEFRRRYHADDAQLYLHIEPTNAMGGMDIEDELERLELKDRGIVHRTGLYHLRSGVDEVTMSQIYGCFDVLLQASSGEGFGVPIIEAQANGVPVIVNDCSAMPELVPNRDLVCADPTPIRSSHGGTHYIPNIDTIVESLNKLYKSSWSGVIERRDEARGWAEQYDWPNLAEKAWKPMLLAIEDAVAPRVWSARAEFNGEDGRGQGEQVKRVGLLWGPDVESEDLAALVTTCQDLEVAICPPDQVVWGLDAYVIVDEDCYVDEDLDRILASGVPILTYVMGSGFGSRKDLHDRAAEILCTDLRWTVAAEEHGIDPANLEKFVEVTNLELWERVAKWLM